MSTTESDATLPHFDTLDPVRLLDAIDAAGWHTDGRIHALNSYENRVYLVGLEDAGHLVAKFYRPGRWSDEAIVEEHRFVAELAAVDIPVVCPLASDDGETLLKVSGFRFCVFPRAGGRPPELDDDNHLSVIGRMLGRMHAVGETARFEHRPALTIERLGHEPLRWLKASDSVPVDVRHAWESSVDAVIDRVQNALESAPMNPLRLHGDCHAGNLLWGLDQLPHWLDFDDCCTGPAVQDVWMFLSGERDYAEARLGHLIDGYLEFREFDMHELALIEPLRALRQVHYAAWIARRWSEPTFQQAFPFFGERRFWDEQVLALKEQLAALDEPPLRYR